MKKQNLLVTKIVRKDTKKKKEVIESINEASQPRDL